MHFPKEDLEIIHSPSTKQKQPIQNPSQFSNLNRKNSTPSKQNKVNIRNLHLKERAPNQAHSSRGTSLPLHTTERDDIEMVINNRTNLPPLIIKSRINGDGYRNITERSSAEPRRVEIRKLLEEAAKKKDEDEKDDKNRIIDDDYDAVGVQLNKVEEKEHVKNLDRWRLEVKRNKSISPLEMDT